MNMVSTNSVLVRASSFFRDRYAYQAEPDYLTELPASSMIVFIALWPIILLTNAMAAEPK